MIIFLLSEIITNRSGFIVKRAAELSLRCIDIIPHIHIGQCYQNAFLIADVYPHVEYIEGRIFNDEWIQHAWNRLNGEGFDLTYQLHLPSLLYCDAYGRLRLRRIEIAGTLEYLETQGYSFNRGFTPLIEQRYGVNAQI